MCVRSYVSLFSSAGVGCFGFKQQGYECILTNELLPRRIQIQKHNQKCREAEGYVCGDITDPVIQTQALAYIDDYLKRYGQQDVDVMIATPPCQGMSVANHKKAADEIVRNSLVLEAIHLVDQIRPKFFVFENVAAFMNTKCGQLGKEKKIGEAIEQALAEQYCYHAEVINFKDYGAHSSRSRCLVIGVRRDLQGVEPKMLWPKPQASKTMRELIYHLPRLSQMGEISPTDIFHQFKAYKPHMRTWLQGLNEGESAFDQVDPMKRPHQIIDGEMVPNANKNGDKYRRQYWDKTPPCVHTRNDILSSQNTVHPEDDRVFSLRELMTFMNVPDAFKWTADNLDAINAAPVTEKQAFLKQHEINIRQSLGEAVPTIIFAQIAQHIAHTLDRL